MKFKNKTNYNDFKPKNMISIKFKKSIKKFNLLKKN